MILRRFMKHVTDQNWFAVGLDVIVVIVGIFLGLQVQEWNENRKNIIAADSYAEQLLVDANQALEITNNNQVLAAKMLGISRNTLRSRIDNK